MEFYNHVHCKYTGIRGFVRVYRYGLKWRYMITTKAKHKAKVLFFWEKHGLQATLDAFPHKRSTLFLWRKQFEQGGKKFEALNEKSKVPRAKRKRLWPEEVIAEIKRQRSAHPNLGKEKIYPALKQFCSQRNLPCPQPRTIGRIMADAPDKMRTFPQKIRHNGQIVALKRRPVLRKPKDFKTNFPGHLVALDTVERFVHGLRRYIITFEDIHSRFSFAWATTSHASAAAQEFFERCRLAFPLPLSFVLTDNGSEFKKHFAQKLKELHLIHYHTYPKTPKMNAHCERFNRTIQEEFVDYHASALIEPQSFNQKLIDWLIWYNTERPHYAFKNQMSPVQYLLSLKTTKINQESKSGWPYTTG
jgi:transposase InsO family protein